MKLDYGRFFVRLCAYVCIDRPTWGLIDVRPSCYSRMGGKEASWCLSSFKHQTGTWFKFDWQLEMDEKALIYEAIISINWLRLIEIIQPLPSKKIISTNAKGSLTQSYDWQRYWWPRFGFRRFSLFSDKTNCCPSRQDLFKDSTEIIPSIS